MYAAAISRTPTWWPKQESLWQCTISTPVDLVLLQITLKVIYEYFPQALNISMCTNLLIFVTSKTRIIMTMVSFFKNSHFSPNFLRICIQQSSKPYNNQKFATSIHCILDLRFFVSSRANQELAISSLYQQYMLTGTVTSP